jgi:hypothetical protein
VEIGEGLWMLVMVVAVLTGLALATGALIAWRTGRGGLALGLIGGVAGLAGLYLITLVTVSLTSPRQVLAAGQVKRFCGFYVDCHLGVSVDGVRTARTLGGPSHPVIARGTFHIVTLRVSSNAIAATLTPYGLLAQVVDDQGRYYRRDRAAERALLGTEGERPIEQPIAAGDAYTRTLVFDLPAEAANPALAVSEQGLLDVLIEMLLIGDEDSLFHNPTLLSLATARDAGATTHAR